MKANNMEILTGRYYNKAVIAGDFTFVGISQGKARFLKYTPVYLKELAPPRDLVKMTDRDKYREAYIPYPAIIWLFLKV